MTRARGLAGKLILMVVAPLLFLGLLESALRVLSTGRFYLFESNPLYRAPDGWFKLRPSQRTWWYGCEYAVNSNGYRMLHEVRQDPPLRVIGLGDSITLGMCVPRARDVWPNRLETLLRERAGADAEVINAGVAGWNLLRAGTNGTMGSAEYTAYMRGEGAQLRPDAVVYCICLNDTPSRVSDLFEIDNARNKARFKLFPEAWREWFKRKALYRLARDGYRETRFRSLDFSGIPTPPANADYWSQVTAELGRLRAACDDLQAPLVALIVPYSYQLLPANRDLLQVTESWQQALTANAIPWRDLSGHLTVENVRTYYGLGDYIHPNARGHALLAEDAYALLREALGPRLRPAGS